MNTDSYFSIGKSHTVCQDYALAGENYVIVSDGCSSSPDTDFGARLLAKVCEQELIAQDYDYSGDAIIYKADAMANHIGLTRQCLDATLITAYRIGGLVHVRMYGDGAVIARTRGGEIHCHTIAYKHNAPAYLSYRLDLKRAELYCDKSEDGFCGGIDYMDGVTTDHGFHGHTGLESHEWSFRECEFDLVMITSDGLESFVKTIVGDTTKSLEAVPLSKVVDQIVDIKGFKGKFAERRYRKFLNKFCPENGWQNNDDFSLAAIYLDE